MKYEKKVAVLKHKIVKKIRPKKRWILFGILCYFQFKYRKNS